MHGILIDVLRAEHRSRQEGPVPPAHELVWLPWVGPFLRLLSGASGDDASGVPGTAGLEGEAAHATCA